MTKNLYFSTYPFFTSNQTHLGCFVVEKLNLTCILLKQVSTESHFRFEQTHDMIENTFFSSYVSNNMLVCG